MSLICLHTCSFIERSVQKRSFYIFFRFATLDPMVPNNRIGTVKFVTLSGPLATRILASEKPELLTRSAKSQLFKTEIPSPDQRKKAAASLFERANALSSGSLKNIFELKSDDIDELPFRVFNPKLPLQHTSPEELDAKVRNRAIQSNELIDSYVAASYCWQQPQDLCPESGKSGTWNPYSTN